MTMQVAITTQAHANGELIFGQWAVYTTPRVEIPAHPVAVTERILQPNSSQIAPGLALVVPV
jgi:hypothetical protein